MYKGPVDKATGGRIDGGRREWVGRWGVVGGKWRQLYLNNNKKKRLCLCPGWVYADKIGFDTFISLKTFQSFKHKRNIVWVTEITLTAQTDQNYTGSFSAFNFQGQVSSLWFSPLLFPYLILSLHTLRVNDINLGGKVFFKIYFAQSPVKKSTTNIKHSCLILAISVNVEILWPQPGNTVMWKKEITRKLRTII